MPHAVRSRSRRSLVVALLLTLTLHAFPVLAGDHGTHSPRPEGLLASLWQAVAALVPGVAQLGPEVDPLGGTPQTPRDSEIDLGPSLDPLG